MALQTEAPRIWNFPVDGTCPQVQPFTLVELMRGIPNHPNYLVQRGSCFVRGIYSMPKTEEEFNVVIKGEIDEGVAGYKKEHPEAKINSEHIKRMTTFLRENYCAHHTTSFSVFRYIDTDGRSIADGLPYQGIITDMKWLAILYFDTQQMIVLPYGDRRDGPHRNLFYDARAKIAGSKWGYDGNLETALTEFNQTGFTFNIARLPSNLEDRRQLMREYSSTPAHHRINGIMTDTNLPLEQILTIISQPPHA